MQHIAQIMGGKLIGNHGSTEIHYLVIDSRKIIFPESSLFFAIKGPHHDGHDYIQKSIEGGILNFVISDVNKINPSELLIASGAGRSDKNIPDICYILVEDTLEALQKLAGFHRNQFKIPIIGITGSNGKTIVKDWLSHVLSVEFNVCKNPKSYNSQVGVPLSVWNLQPETEIGIFESGISQKSEMHKLENILNPTIGIFTNIGSAHEENFASKEEKILEKLRLFKKTDAIILHSDDTAIERATRKTYPNKKIITWGGNEQATYHFNFKKKQTP